MTSVLQPKSSPPSLWLSEGLLFLTRFWEFNPFVQTGGSVGSTRALQTQGPHGEGGAVWVRKYPRRGWEAKSKTRSLEERGSSHSQGPGCGRDSLPGSNRENPPGHGVRSGAARGEGDPGGLRARRWDSARFTVCGRVPGLRLPEQLRKVTPHAVQSPRLSLCPAPQGAEGLLWANVSQCPLLRTLSPPPGGGHC